MTITAIANQKGGVGKTSIAAQLAYQLGLTGQRCLLIDLDPQVTVTGILGIELTPETPTVFDLLGPEAPTRSQVLATITPAAAVWGSLMCMPSERSLAAFERDSSVGREQRVKRLLTMIREDFDQIIIDCPPSLGLLTVNGLTAADQVLVISEPRVASAQAVGEVMATTASVKAYYNAELRVAGILLNKFLQRRPDQEDWLGQLQAAYGDLVFEFAIPEREVIARAASDAVPAVSIARGRELRDLFELLATRITTPRNAEEVTA